MISSHHRTEREAGDCLPVSRSHFRAKSPLYLETQVGVYAAHEDYTATLRMQRSIGGIAAGPLTQRIDYTKYNIDTNGFEDMRLGYPDYLDFLRRHHKENREKMQYKVALTEAFSEFEVDAMLLQARVRATDRDDAREIPGFVGGGCFAFAFRLEREGRQYVIRIPRTGPEARDVNAHMDIAYASLEVEGLEKVVAASFDHGITVSELAPGKSLDSLSYDEIDAIPEVQLEELFYTCRETFRRGVALDARSGNLLYDSEQGFTALDGSMAHPSDPLSPTAYMDDMMLYAPNVDRGDDEHRSVESIIIYLDKVEAIVSRNEADNPAAEGFLKRLVDQRDLWREALVRDEG